MKKEAAKKSGSRFGFFNDIIAELRKVVWPTRQETIRLTVMVIIVILVLGIILGLLDWGFTKLVEHFFIVSS
jgi:preprotein translocase subunit SecE